MDYEQSTWRLIENQPGTGAWNMAVDEAILDSVNNFEELPTLRLYAWDPPCLSLGHAQPFSEVDTQTLAREGWDVVRRPTGGRAIRHIDELTYAVIAHESEPRMQGGVLASYLTLSKALLKALVMIGLSPQANEKQVDKTKKQNPVCFEVPSNYEITVNGKKLIGSAQARRKEGILQHGALPLYGDLTRIISALQLNNNGDRENARLRLLEHATTVEIELGSQIPWHEVSKAFQLAFQRTLNLKLIPGTLSSVEINRAKTLVAEKYANNSWTKRI
jgi:lipoate-protein ligase A